MQNKHPRRPFAAVLGTGLVVTLAASPLLQADTNPFAAVEYQDAYLLAADGAEASCGAAMAEGKCGSAPEAATTAKDAQSSAPAAATDAVATGSDAKAGEGKLGN